MAHYRKKPVVIEAWNSLGEIPPDVQIRQNQKDQWQVFDYLHTTWVKFERGDWIIKGVKGEFYPCKADVFIATYEAG